MRLFCYFNSNFFWLDALPVLLDWQVIGSQFACFLSSLSRRVNHRRIGYATTFKIKQFILYPFKINDLNEFNPIRLSWVVSDPRHFFFWSHYSKSVYPKNTYPYPKKTLGPSAFTKKFITFKPNEWIEFFKKHCKVQEAYFYEKNHELDENKRNAQVWGVN